MENASKALIIAGAILLSILIISLGIMIFGRARDAADDDQISQLGVESFNEKFEQYCGTKVNGAKVNELIKKVNSNNRTQTDDSRKITLDGVNETSAGSGQYKKEAKTGKTYDVQVTSTTDTGYVSVIKITE